MLSVDLIRANLDNCLSDTSFLSIPGLRKGKVRDVYDLGDKLLLVSTDRQSAFDRILASVPFKGQVLNEISSFWFEKTADIIPNHIISIPDPNATLAKKCRVIPIEFVVRGYLTGSTSTSAWTQYQSGSRNVCGNQLPDGMRKNQKFERPIITPTTKSDEHDESITPDEIIAREIVDKQTWARLEEIVLALFDRGEQIASKNGLILVDTKYEIGINDAGKLTLIDEVHSPDSSRFWLSDSYEEKISRNEEPENIDKEFLRLWFVKNSDPYHDQVLPAAPPELVVELSRRYVQLYEMITGRAFKPELGSTLQQRLKRNLENAAIG